MILSSSFISQRIIRNGKEIKKEKKIKYEYIKNTDDGKKIHILITNSLEGNDEYKVEVDIDGKKKVKIMDKAHIEILVNELNKKKYLLK
jgi:hypothetical protein